MTLPVLLSVGHFSSQMPILSNVLIDVQWVCWKQGEPAMATNCPKFSAAPRKIRRSCIPSKEYGRASSASKEYNVTIRNNASVTDEYDILEGNDAFVDQTLNSDYGGKATSSSSSKNRGIARPMRSFAAQASLLQSDVDLGDFASSKQNLITDVALAPICP